MKCKNYLLSLLENIPLWYEDVQGFVISFNFLFLTHENFNHTHWAFCKSIFI
jgi:hypothetical protein